MPLTGDRMLAVIDAAERIRDGNAEVERFALFRPAELDTCAGRVAALRSDDDPQTIIDEARAVASDLISMYDGLIDRIRTTLRPSLEDIATITREGQHFRTAGRHNAAARQRMRNARNNRLDGTGTGTQSISAPRHITKEDFQTQKAIEKVEENPDFQKFQAELAAKWNTPAAQTPGDIPIVVNPTMPEGVVEIRGQNTVTITNVGKAEDERAKYERERDERLARERAAPTPPALVDRTSRSE
jgi:hypothetical protein